MAPVMRATSIEIGRISLLPSSMVLSVLVIISIVAAPTQAKWGGAGPGPDNRDVSLRCGRRPRACRNNRPNACAALCRARQLIATFPLLQRAFAGAFAAATVPA